MQNTQEVSKEEEIFFEKIRQQILNAPEGVDVTPLEKALENIQSPLD